jgi:hypothetical protein
VDAGVWSEAVTWLGSRAALLDLEKAFATGLLLQPLTEGKKFVIYVGTLSEIFFPTHTCPADIRSVEVGSQATQTIVAVIESCVKFAAPSCTPAQCSEVAFGQLLGQMLWLMSFLLDKWAPFFSEEVPCPLPALVLVATLGCRCGDSGSVARVVDWLSRGGTRDSVPADDVDLREAFFGTGADKSKKAGKSKGSKDDASTAASLVKGVVWIRRANFKSTVEFPSSSAAPLSPRAEPLRALLSAYADGRREFEDASAIGFLRRYSKRSNGATQLYIVGLLSEEEQLGSELMVRSSLGLVELIVACVLDVSGVRYGEEGVTLATNYIYPASDAMVREASGLAVLGDMASLASLSEAGAELGLEAQQRVTDLLVARRISLSPSLLMRLHDLTLEHSINPRLLVDAIHSLQAASMELADQGGAFISALATQVRELETRLATRRVGADEGREDGARLCASSLQTLATMVPEACSRQNMCTLVNELVCCIGDCIDERHMLQSRLVSTLGADIAADLDFFLRGIIQLSIKLAQACGAVYRSVLIAQSAVKALLQSAGYEQALWLADDVGIGEGLSVKLWSALDELCNEIGDDSEVRSQWDPLLMELNDPWLPGAIVDVQRSSLALVRTLLAALYRARAMTYALPASLQSRADEQSVRDHAALSAWDAVLTEVLRGDCGDTTDLRRLLVQTRAADTGTRLKSWIENHGFMLSVVPASSGERPVVSLEAVLQVLKLDFI